MVQLTKRDEAMLDWLSVVRMADQEAVRWALAAQRDHVRARSAGNLSLTARSQILQQHVGRDHRHGQITSAKPPSEIQKVEPVSTNRPR